MNNYEEAVYCAMKHFASFYQQAMMEKKADFGEPCIDCNLYAECGCDLKIILWLYSLYKAQLQIYYS